MSLHIPATRRAGLGLALVAAVISGFAVYGNGFAVRHAPSALSFTTAKNLIAAAIIATLSCASLRRREPARRAPLRARHWIGLAFVGVAGGGLAFALFFEGLARADAAQAAFVQKSLVLWVALLAVPLLRERVGWQQAAAVAVLLGGNLLLAGSLTHGRAPSGLVLVLAATLLWSVETVIARTLLRTVTPALLGAVRMGVGCVALVAWLAATQRLGQLGAAMQQWPWVVLTGLLLAGYVTTWFGALRRAPAVDVTAVLVFGAVITTVLSLPGTRTMTVLQYGGLLLIVAGVMAVMRPWQRRARPATVAAAP